MGSAPCGISFTCMTMYKQWNAYLYSKRHAVHFLFLFSFFSLKSLFKNHEALPDPNLTL